jgi:hypothetical protein
VFVACLPKEGSGELDGRKRWQFCLSPCHGLVEAARDVGQLACLGLHRRPRALHIVPVVGEVSLQACKLRMCCRQGRGARCQLPLNRFEPLLHRRLFLVEGIVCSSGGVIYRLLLPCQAFDLTSEGASFGLKGIRVGESVVVIRAKVRWMTRRGVRRPQSLRISIPTPISQSHTCANLLCDWRSAPIV